MQPSRSALRPLRSGSGCCQGKIMSKRIERRLAAIEAVLPRLPSIPPTQAEIAAKSREALTYDGDDPVLLAQRRAVAEFYLRIAARRPAGTVREETLRKLRELAQAVQP